jgi:hypothetical protein
MATNYLALLGRKCKLKNKNDPKLSNFGRIVYANNFAYTLDRLPPLCFDAPGLPSNWYSVSEYLLFAEATPGYIRIHLDHPHHFIVRFDRRVGKSGRVVPHYRAPHLGSLILCNGEDGRRDVVRKPDLRNLEHVKVKLHYYHADLHLKPLSIFLRKHVPAPVFSDETDQLKNPDLLLDSILLLDALPDHLVEGEVAQE